MKKIAAIFTLAAVAAACDVDVKQLTAPPAPEQSTAEFSSVNGRTNNILAIKDAAIVQEVVNAQYMVTVNYKDSLLVKSVGTNINSSATPVDMAIHFRDVKDTADLAKIKSLKSYLTKTAQPK